MPDEGNDERLRAMQGLGGQETAEQYAQQQQEEGGQEQPEQEGGPDQPQEPAGSEGEQGQEQGQDGGQEGRPESYAERIQREYREQQEQQEEAQEGGQEGQEQQEGEGGQEGGQEQSQEDPLDDNPLVKARREAMQEGGEISSLDDLTERAKNDLGIEAEKPDDVIKEFKRYKESADKLGEVEKERDQIKGIIDNLPEDMFEAINQWYEQGKDPREVINSRPNLDFSRTEQDVPEKELLNAYFPNEFSDEDLEAIKNGEADERLKKAYDVTVSRAKENFRGDKEKFSQKQKEREETMQQRQKQFNESLERSMRDFSEKFPGADRDYSEGVKQVLENPSLLFYNEDGTLKQDAAVKAALAQDGYELVDRHVQKQRTEAKSEARREEAKKHPQKPDPQKTKGTGKGSGGKLSPEAQKQLEDLRRLQGDRTY